MKQREILKEGYEKANNECISACWVHDCMVHDKSMGFSCCQRYHTPSHLEPLEVRTLSTEYVIASENRSPNGD